MNSIQNSNEDDNAIFKVCNSFIKEFHINRLLRNSNATKEKGVPAYDVFAFLMGVVFCGSNFFTLLKNCREKVPFGKDVVYRFLNMKTINWNSFLQNLACTVFPEVDRLTEEDRKSAFVIDDSPYYRGRSKKVEMLSRCYDHVKNCYYKGLTLLGLGWTDGQTFLPVNFQLLASGNDSNLLEGSHIREDRRTLATRRRIAARKEKPELVLDMLRAAKDSALKAKYVLFDSWFASPSAIMNIREIGFHVVARLKNHENYRYGYQGESLSLSRIYRANSKRRGRSRYLLSVNVDVRHEAFPCATPAKLVYVRDKANRKKWIALLSTDTSMTEDEIVALYGKRWDIETFFKVIKSYLRLEKEFQVRSFDALTAHTAIVMSRYILLSIENRKCKDERTICELFYVMCKELDDISFGYAFSLIMETLKQCVDNFFYVTKSQIGAFVEQFLSDLPSIIKGKLRIAMCES